MKINTTAIIDRLCNLKSGEVFSWQDNYYIATDSYGEVVMAGEERIQKITYNKTDARCCVKLSSGSASFLSKDLPVVKVFAELNTQEVQSWNHIAEEYQNAVLV